MWDREPREPVPITYPEAGRQPSSGGKRWGALAGPDSSSAQTVCYLL